MALCIIPLHLSFTLSLSQYRIKGMRGRGKKRSGGNQQQDAEGTRTHRRIIQLQHLEKKTTCSFYNTLKLQPVVTLRSGHAPLSVCTAVFSLSLHSLCSCNTLPLLVYMVKQFLLNAYLGDKGSHN